MSTERVKKKAGEILPIKVRRELEECIAKFRKRQLVALSLLFAAGVGMLLLTLLPAARNSETLTSSDRGITLISFLRYAGALIVALGVFGMFKVRRTARRRRLILDTLTQRPQELAWLYLEEISFFTPGGAFAVRPHLHLRDGTHAFFPVSRAAAEALFAVYEREFPWMCLGYEPGLRRRLRRDPDALAADPVRSRKSKKSVLRYIKA